MFNALQAVQAGQAGQANRERRERKNAFAQAGQSYMDGDYKGAANALMPHDASAGMQMAQYGQQQTKTAETEQLRKMYEVTQLLAKEPDVMKRVQMAQQMSPGLGIPAPTDPSDYTDDVLQRELDEMRIKGGFEQEGPDQFTLSQGQVRYDANGNVVADNPEIAGSDVPWYITEDGVDPRYIEAQQADGASGGPRVQSAFTGQDNQRYAIMSDGSVRPLGVNERNPFQIVDFGGLPTAVDRITGETQELSSIDEVASNEAVTTEATETAKQNVTAKAEDRQARIGFARRANNQIPKLEAAIKAVDDAIKTSNARNTGAIKVPFSGVQALGGLLTTLEANLAFNELGDMRRNSPTGGALGNVSEGELRLLGSTIANLSQDQSEGRLDKNLETVKASLNLLLAAMREDAAYTVEGSTLTPELQALDDEISRLEQELGL
jgi:hypothetical protein